MGSRPFLRAHNKSVMSTKVLVIVGSIRKGSFSRMVAKSLAEVAPSGMEFEFADISRVSIFTQDSEENPPQDWLDFRNQIKAADAILFVTPEYNRSIPGVLKNAIDVGSRPYGANSFDGKPAAIVSTSVGAIAGFGANHHLRQICAYLNMSVMGQPEAYVGNTGGMFDESGNVKSEDTKKFFASIMGAFAEWVDRVKK